MTDEKKKRRAPISYRPPKGREEEFAALVAASGLSVNAFLNDCVFTGRRRAERKQVGLLLASAARISDHVDAIDLAGAGNSTLAREAIREELILLRAALLALNGRKP